MCVRARAGACACAGVCGGQRELLAGYDSAGLGICRRTFEPVTSRTTQLYCNPAHAAMTNLSVAPPPQPTPVACTSSLYK